MRDIALDPLTGDLLLVNGAARLTSAGGESARQRLQIRLGLWRGEYVLDLTKGIPYTQLLGMRGALPRFRSMLRSAAVSSPGISSLDAFSVTLGIDRAARVSLVARTSTGEPISLDDFQVAA